MRRSLDDGDESGDWAYCQDALREVSRTFSKPIEMLPEGLREAVTCGYLLCRIADTVEDRPDLALSERDTLWGALLGVLEDGRPADHFTTAYGAHLGSGSDDALCRSLGRVMGVFLQQPPRVRKACVPWIAEMIRGMAIYAHREPGADGINAVADLPDLERYCWFVAGTVGRMLTELFLGHLGSSLDQGRARALRLGAGEFGLGLQLTNVLKDVTDDRERRVSYIPRELVRGEGLTLAELCEPTAREAAHRALTPVFDRARVALDGAFAYVLALPSEAREIRLFCLLPIWMAQRTLHLARGNDDIFVAGRPVKITRDEVTRLIDDCVARCEDDDALREGWRALLD
jgi:farnesyl-diphosphate farnesyltransferase